MSKNFLYVIEVWDGKKLLFDAIRATRKDAQRKRKELKPYYQAKNVIKIIRYKRVSP